MANTTVFCGLAIAKFVVVETVANATVRRGPAPAEFVLGVQGGGPDDQGCAYDHLKW